jgi:polyhydroxybutyrate depolymerase
VRTPEQRQVIGASVVAVAVIVVAGVVAVVRSATHETVARPRPAAEVAGASTVVTAAPDDGPAGPATGPARPSAGCTGGTPGPAGPEARTIDVGGTARSYRLTVPAAPAGQPRALVLDLHGLGFNAEQHAGLSGWDKLTAAEPPVVVQPEAVKGLWTVTPDDANTDVAYLRAVIEAVAGERCVDRSRVYAGGLSMGALMASVLACKAPDLVAAVGLVSGMQLKPECQGAPAKPAVVLWGTADCVLPYFGGLGPCLAVGPPGRVVPTAPLPPGQDMGFPPAETLAQAWATRNGCRPAGDESIAAHVAIRRWRACQDEAIVDLYTIDGGGHTWPGNQGLHDADVAKGDTGRGITTDEVDATTTLWSFFQQFQLPA